MAYAAKRAILSVRADVAMQFDRMELCGLCGTLPLSYVDPEVGTGVTDDMIGIE